MTGKIANNKTNKQIPTIPSWGLPIWPWIHEVLCWMLFEFILKSDCMRSILKAKRAFSNIPGSNDAEFNRRSAKWEDLDPKCATCN